VPIQRLAYRPTDDEYHQPKQAKEPREPYNPRTFLKSCITTSGPTEYHYSGMRRYTARELSLFQSFPIDYKFYGSQGQAVKQIGNAFPPIVAEVLYRTIAKTLEAFDRGFIDAEDDLSDLDELLERNGVTLQRPPSVPRALFDPPSRVSSLQSRYLVRDDRPGPSRSSSSSFFTQRRASRPQQPRDRSNAASQPIDLLDGLFDGINETEDDDVRESTRIRRPPQIIQNLSREVIEISSESESESDSD
jgi:DNA (cytosine-5)-methyltransferase 1